RGCSRLRVPRRPRRSRSLYHPRFSSGCLELRRLLRDLAESVRLRILRGVRVLGTGVDLQLLHLGTSETILRNHTGDSLLDCTLGVGGQELGVVDALEAAGVSGVAVSALPLELRHGQRDLVGVDDDDEVTGVDIRSKGGLVLAAQEACNLRSKATEHLVSGVDDVLLALAVT